jgi:hypothetical protein
MSSETLTLKVHCPRCGRAVTVEYRPEPQPPQETAPPAWSCPHWQCSGLHPLSGVRDIVAVWKGHGPKTPGLLPTPPVAESPPPL